MRREKVSWTDGRMPRLALLIPLTSSPPPPSLPPYVRVGHTVECMPYLALLIAVTQLLTDLSHLGPQADNPFALHIRCFLLCYPCL